MQQHAASFAADTEASTGGELPRFIKDEFDVFLVCGILAHGSDTKRVSTLIAALCETATRIGNML